MICILGVGGAVFLEKYWFLCGALECCYGSNPEGNLRGGAVRRSGIHDEGYANHSSTPVYIGVYHTAASYIKQL